MIPAYIELIRSFLARYGLVTVFGVGVFEEFFFFIPSTMFFVALGFFMIPAATPFFSAFVAAFSHVGFLSALGILIGGFPLYVITYVGGKPVIDLLGRYVRLKWSDFERLDRWLEGNSAHSLVLFAMRCLPMFPIGITSFFCGIIRVRAFVFVWTTFLGSLVRVTLLAFLGWYLGREYERYADVIANTEHIFLFALLIIVLVWVGLHTYRKRRFIQR